MNSGVDPTGNHGRHGRHRKGVGGDTWTPDVPQNHEHVGGATIAGSIVDLDLFPNLRPGKHEAPAEHAGFAPSTPIEFFDDRPTETSALAVLDPFIDDEPTARTPSVLTEDHAAEPESELTFDEIPPAMLEPKEYDELRYDDEVDPLADTDSLGLSKFNLGTVPASVTPPRSWRRAAWFSVAASAAALTALVTVSAAFVNNSGKRTIIDALPTPGMLQTTTDAPDDSRAPSTTERSGRPSARTSTAPVTRLVDANHDGIFETVVVDTAASPDGRHSAPESSADESALDPTAPNTAPTTTNEPSEPPTDTSTPPPPPREPRVNTVTPDPLPRALGMTANTERQEQKTKQFAADPVATANASTAMTDTEKEAVSTKYREVESVTITEMTVDPNKRTTVSECEVRYKDGTTKTETTTLTFTSGQDPQVTSAN